MGGLHTHERTSRHKSHTPFCPWMMSIIRSYPCDVRLPVPHRRLVRLFTATLHVTSIRMYVMYVCRCGHKTRVHIMPVGSDHPAITTQPIPGSFERTLSHESDFITDARKTINTHASGWGAIGNNNHHTRNDHPAGGRRVVSFQNTHKKRENVPTTCPCTRFLSH